MFCGIVIIIVLGVVVEWMKFGIYLFVVFLVLGFIYFIFGYWVWNGIDIGVLRGWLG